MSDFIDKDRKRAIRRIQKARKKKKWERIIESQHWLDNVDEEFKKKFINIYADTGKPCSCDKCCNRRKIEGPTRKERLFNDEI